MGMNPFVELVVDEDVAQQVFVMPSQWVVTILGCHLPIDGGSIPIFLEPSLLFLGHARKPGLLESLSPQLERRASE